MSKTDDSEGIGWDDKAAAGRRGVAQLTTEQCAAGGRVPTGLAKAIYDTPPDEGWAGVVERARRRGYLGGGDSE